MLKHEIDRNPCRPPQPFSPSRLSSPSPLPGTFDNFVRSVRCSPPNLLRSTGRTWRSTRLVVTTWSRTRSVLESTLRPLPCSTWPSFTVRLRFRVSTMTGEGLASHWRKQRRSIVVSLLRPPSERLSPQVGSTFPPLARDRSYCDRSLLLGVRRRDALPSTRCPFFLSSPSSLRSGLASPRRDSAPKGATRAVSRTVPVWFVAGNDVGTSGELDEDLSLPSFVPTRTDLIFSLVQPTNTFIVDVYGLSGSLVHSSDGLVRVSQDLLDSNVVYKE